jgi:hypothetical protein
MSINLGSLPLPFAVTNKAALSALGTIARSVLVKDRTTVGDNGGGLFTFRTGDQSAYITADPQGGVWVAPDSDPTGASGAWQRLYAGALNLRWFGGVGNNSTDNQPAWASIDTYVATLNSGRQEAAEVFVPAGIYKQSATTLASSYIIRGEGDEATEFRPMTSAQAHIFQFTGPVAQMRDFGILGWATRTPADFALVGIISDGGEYEFTNYRVYNCVEPFWHKRGRRYNNHTGSIGVLGEGGIGIHLAGVDGAANALTAQSCVNNPITAQSWSGGVLTFTTTNAHGFAPYDSFIIYGATPSGYNGTFRAVSGTTGSTLRAELVADPGASSVLGTMTVATFVATDTTRVRRTAKFNIYGSSPNGYNGQWIANTGSTGATLVACLSSNPGASTVLGTSSAARGWGAVTSETRIGPKVAVYSGSSSASLQNLLGQSWSSGTVTYTTEFEPNMEVGDQFTVRGSIPTGYNGTFTATAVGEREVSAALVTNPNLTPNTLTSQTWLNEVATYTTTTAHGLAPGDVFTISGSVPTGYSGTFTAISGTAGSTITAVVSVDPGASSTLGNLIVYGEIYGRYNGTAILLDTDNGATIIENSETGSCNYAIRIADTLGLGDQDGDNYRGTGFLKLRGITTGNCGIAGVSIEANGRSFKAFSSSFSAPGADNADGVYIDSNLASPQITGCEFHSCRATGIRLRNAYSLAVKGSIFSDIGTRGGGTPGVGLRCETGAADVYFSENTVNPDLQLNTSATMDYAVLLAADDGDDAFTGTVYVAANTMLDMNIADYGDLSTSGTFSLVNDDFVVAPSSSTAAQFQALVSANAVVWITEPFTNTWTETCDLSGLNGKKIISLPCYEPIIVSSATPAIRVGGDDHRFNGDWWIKCSTETSVDTLCVEVTANSYRHYWDTFKPEDFGIGMQGTKGVIREIITRNFEPLNLLSFGKRFYSSDSNSEIGLLRDDRIYTSITDSDADNCIMYSVGPNVGSGGLIGYEHGGGLLYGAKHALHVWGNVPILTQSWLSNVVTYTTEEPHGVQVGNEFVITSSAGTVAAGMVLTAQSWFAGVLSYTTTSAHGLSPGDMFTVENSSPSGYNGTYTAITAAGSSLTAAKTTGVGASVTLGNVGGYNGTFVAIAGTTDRTLKATMKLNPGASTTLGTFGPAATGVYNYAQTPRSIRWENFTRRGGTNTSFRFSAGADVAMINCKSDDAGTACTQTAQSWSGGVSTFALATDAGVRIGDYFFVEGANPSGYRGTQLAVSGTTATAVKASTATDPGLTPNTLTAQTRADNVMTAASWLSGTVTFTCTSPHGFASGDTFIIYGATNAAYNGTYTATTGTTGSTLTANLTNNPGAASGSFGTITVVTATTTYAHDFLRTKTFTTAGNTPSGYDGTFKSNTGTTASTIVYCLNSNPGACTVPGVMTSLGTFYSEGHGVHLERNFQGVFSWIGGQFHENTNGFRNEAINATSVTVKDTLIYNSSNNDQAGVWSGYYQDPACSNVTLENVTSGTQDSWRPARRTITFTGVPTTGDTITFNGTVVTWRTTAALPNEITIPGTAALTAQALADFINGNSQNVLSVIGALVSDAVVTVFHYPGTVGNSYTLAEATSNCTISGSPLAGGTGTGFQKYGFEGITHGLRNCVIINCNGRNNLSGAFSQNQFQFPVTFKMTASGTFGGFANATRYEIFCWSGGGGGGSGRRGAAASARSGGLAGGGTVPTRLSLPAAAITFPVTVTIGAGGTGGAAVGVDDTSGNDGTAGGNTTFGTYLQALGGNKGVGGGTAALNPYTALGAATQASGRSFPAATSVTASILVTNANDNSGHELGGGAGGSGGSISTGNADLLGIQANYAGFADPALSAPVGPAAADVAGTAGSNSALDYIAGFGGGGGGPRAAGGAGGRGSGGGGGGASLNGTASGAGGAGGGGQVTIIGYSD